jgi:lipopolysaccharide exporter
MSSSILIKSARGSVYNIAVSAITILLGFTRSVLLMRLLGVDSFGVITLALFFSTFILPLSTLGIDNALIQEKLPTKNSFSTHFSLRILLNLLVIVLSFLFSPLLRLFYDDLLVNVFLILMVISLLESSYATPMVVLRRDLRFGPIAILNLCTSLAMTVITPLLAYLGFGIWSLVVEHALGPLVRWIGIWIFIHPWRLTFKIDIKEARAQIKFGAQVVFSNLLGILLDRFDDFWTGTALGATALGYYSRAYELAQYPERVLATPITNVFFSTYAAIQDKRIELSKAFFRSSSFLVRAGLLLSIILFTITPELVILLFTDKWLPIVPIFQLMLIYIILDPFYNNLSFLLIGVGQPGILTKVRLFQVGMFIISVIIFARIWGTNGVALAANLMMLSGTLPLILISKRIVDYSIKRLFLWPLIAAGLASITAIMANTWIVADSAVLSMVLKGVPVAFSYLVVLIIAERKDYRRHGLMSIHPILAQLKNSLPGLFKNSP